jgi:hypothetical protein
MWLAAARKGKDDQTVSLRVRWEGGREEGRKRGKEGGIEGGREGGCVFL